MASDDFEVLAFKILSYLYRRMKSGKKVDITALRQLVGCNETYFGAVVRSLQSKGLVEGCDLRERELANAQGKGLCRARIRGRPFCGNPGGSIAYIAAPNTFEQLSWMGGRAAYRAWLLTG